MCQRVKTVQYDISVFTAVMLSDYFRTDRLTDMVMGTAALFKKNNNILLQMLVTKNHSM